jgi:hypothetical protein
MQYGSYLPQSKRHVMVPEDTHEQLLNLQNGYVVWVALNDSLTVIEKFELWYYPDGSKPKTTTVLRLSNLRAQHITPGLGEDGLGHHTRCDHRPVPLMD